MFTFVLFTFVLHFTFVFTLVNQSIFTNLNIKKITSVKK